MRIFGLDGEDVRQLLLARLELGLATVLLELRKCEERQAEARTESLRPIAFDGLLEDLPNFAPEPELERELCETQTRERVALIREQELHVLGECSLAVEA